MQEACKHVLFPNMHITFRGSTGTISGLWTDTVPSFSCVPRDGAFGANRSLPGYFALGDIAMRLRSTQGLLRMAPETLQGMCFIITAYSSLQYSASLLVLGQSTSILAGPTPTVSLHSPYLSVQEFQGGIVFSRCML